MATKTSIDIEHTLLAGFQAADGGLRKAATFAAGLERARAATAAREVSRVSDKRGRGSAAAKAAAERAVAARHRANSVSLLAGRAAITPFDVPENAATVHGRILTADNAPVAELAVRVEGLHDKEHTTHTDARGYFRLDLDGDRAVPPAGQRAGAGAADGKGVVTADGKVAAGASRALRLVVLRDGKPVYKDEAPFQVRLGSALYRELTVKD